MNPEQILLLPQEGAVVLECQQRLSTEQIERVKAEFALASPRLKVVILHGGIKIVKSPVLDTETSAD